jgi:hypothetical protein
VLNVILFPVVVLLSLLLVVLALITNVFSKLTEVLAYIVSLILLNTKSEFLFKTTQILVALGGMTTNKPREQYEEDYE